MSGMFSGCSRLGEFELVGTDIYEMVNDSKIWTLDLSNFNTDNVEDISDMFSGCESLEQLDLRNFNLKKVTKSENMFNGCVNLKVVYIDKKDHVIEEELRNMHNGDKFFEYVRNGAVRPGYYRVDTDARNNSYKFKYK